MKIIRKDGMWLFTLGSEEIYCSSYAAAAWLYLTALRLAKEKP